MSSFTSECRRVRSPRVNYCLLLLSYGVSAHAQGVDVRSSLTVADEREEMGNNDTAERSNTAEREPSTPPQVIAPTLRHYEAASVPDGLREATAIDLELTIGETGEVQRVTATGDDGDSELTALAVAAAQQFTFTPALRVHADGTREPIAVVIGYRYWFRPPEPEAEEVQSPGPKQPTDEALEPSPASAAPSGSASAPSEEEEVYEATATVEAPPREPTKRRLEQQELTRVAGTRGDPLRAIEIMPGVGQSDGDAPLIRGASGYESAAFLDGSQVPMLYHFGGLTSFVHPRLVNHVELYPGNFSARYGRVTGGIVEAGLRNPAKRFGFIADANLLDSSLLVEGPITDRLTVAVAGRRSNIDLVFDSVVPSGTFSTIAAPVYFDYQALVHYETPKGSEFRIAVFGSRDSLRLLFDEPSQLDPAFRGNVDASIEFHRVQLLHKTRLGNVKQRVQASLGTQDLNQSFGSLVTGYFDIYEFDSRGEWEWNASDAFSLIGGFDVTGQQLRGAYRGPAAPAQEGSPMEGPASEVVINERTISMLNPAVYLEARVNPLPFWQVVPGVRADYYHQIGDLTLNPRLSQRFWLGPDWVLKTGVGLYSQPPIYHEALEPIGNPNIQAYHSVHSSLGVEHELVEGLKVDVEGFHKYLYDRVVGTPNGEPPRFVNDGVGLIYGVEVGATYRSNYGLTGQLSYTLSSSQRRDRDEAWRRFDQEQPHILNVAGTYDLGAGWELGTRFRYISGNPSTPIDGSTYDANRGVFIPLYGRLNADRDPAFHQLDIRGQKTFRIGEGSLSVYLDVQNVYNAENPRGFSYSYDYREREPAASSFILPNLGIRGQL